MFLKRAFVFLFSYFLFIAISFSQEQSLVKNAILLNPEKEFDNVFVQKMYSDSLSSVFCIWIKKEVKLHKHIEHTEQVFVLKGKGKMILKDKEFEIKEGDVVSIPQNTPHKVTVIGDEILKVLSIHSPEFDGKDRVILE